jgi:hypothetical protein
VEEGEGGEAEDVEEEALEEDEDTGKEEEVVVVVVIEERRRGRGTGSALLFPGHQTRRLAPQGHTGRPRGRNALSRTFR